MVQLKFWDIGALLDIIRTKPRILEQEREPIGREPFTDFECSEYHYTTEDFSEFDTGDIQDSYKCPECWKELFTESEIEDLVEVKRKSFNFKS